MNQFQLNEITKTRLLAGGGVIGALLESACCVLPLTFAVVGVSGAWIGGLTALAPYQPIFLLFAAACIGFGFWRAYGVRNCDETCGTPLSRRLTRGVLWLAAIVLVIAATAEWWAPLLG
jgi:mercuric ion transport protein